MTNPPELLTDADLAPLRGWCREPEASINDLRIVVERIVRARMADAWRECAKEAHDLGWLHDAALADVLARTPYRDQEPTA